MLIDEIKKANMDALRSKDKEARAALSIIINKYTVMAIERKSENIEITEIELIAIITKTLKELDDEKAGFEKVGNVDRVAAINRQIEAVKVYLPMMLSEAEIKAEILKLENRTIPAVMSHFKEHFAGKVDMGLVSKVARSL